MISMDNYIANVLTRSLALAALLFVVTAGLHAQERDLRGERVVLDDNGADSTTNTVTIRTSSTLLQNVILTIPDPGMDSAEFLLISSGGGTLGYWELGGNGGTTPGTNFIGTTDSTALQFQVRGGSGTVVNSLILNKNRSIQRDMAGNARGASAVDLQIARSAGTDVASSNYSVISGGEGNGIENTSGTYSTIRGGSGNAMHSNQSRYGVIGGGSNGEIGSTQNAMIGGGGNNVIDSSAQYAAILGGRSNFINLSYGAFIGGGGSNTLDNYCGVATIGGGESNEMSISSYSTILGGGSNFVYWANPVVIGGGLGNRIQDISDRSTIGGGRGNIVDLGCGSATIRGGSFTWIRRRTYFPNDSYATVGGGGGHTVGQGPGTTTSDATDATVGGGAGQIIGVNGESSTIGGGWSNRVEGPYSAIPGGLSLKLNGDHSFGFLANGGSNSMTISESDVAVLGNTDVWLANNNNRASRLRLYEAYDTTGAFPGSAHYTSFEAPALTDTILYILPATKPSATGLVLAVSAISGDTVTLIWKTDDTVAAHRTNDVPTAIAAPNDDSRLRSRMTELESWYEEQERRFEAQEEKLNALETGVSELKGRVGNR